MSGLTDGKFSVGLHVSCTGEAYVSDTASLVIDRTAPQALTHSVKPPGHSLVVGGAVGVSFTEAINCTSLVVAASLSNGKAFKAGTNFGLLCAEDHVQLVFTPAQVCLLCWSTLFCEC